MYSSFLVVEAQVVEKIAEVKKKAPEVSIPLYYDIRYQTYERCNGLLMFHMK